MSDYSKSTDFAAKDGLASGNPSKIIKGEEIDDEFNAIASASASKANKVSGDYEDNIVTLTASGDIQNSGLAAPASAVVGVDDTQTFTNKTLTNPLISGAIVRATGSTNVDLELGSKGTGSLLLTTNASSTSIQAKVLHTASAVNFLTLTGSPTSATVNGPTIAADGSDTNIGIKILAKGTGAVSLIAGSNGVQITGGIVCLTGGIALAGHATSSLAAASGYTRATPNYCYNSGLGSATSLSAGTTTIAAPSGATLVVVSVGWTIPSGSGNGEASVHATDAAGTTNYDIVDYSFAKNATYSSTGQGDKLYCPVISGNIYLTTTLSGSATAGYQIIGYMD